MTERQEAAEKYASQFYDKKYSTHTDCVNDFLAGYDTAKEHMDREHREFYLLVRSLVKRLPAHGEDQVLDRIEKALTAFTEREQQQLPL